MSAVNEGDIATLIGIDDGDENVEVTADDVLERSAGHGEVERVGDTCEHDAAELVEFHVGEFFDFAATEPGEEDGDGGAVGEDTELEQKDIRAAGVGELVGLVGAVGLVGTSGMTADPDVTRAGLDENLDGNVGTTAGQVAGVAQGAGRLGR